jgi:mRNA-degrading endonuclease RelE of RelBE toxin-antitoxin system
VTYEVFVEPEIHRTRDRLPGNVRQRVRRIISDLADEPRPAASTAVDLAGLDVPPGVEVRRYRLDPWRVVYAVNDEATWVWVGTGTAPSSSL